MSTSTTVPSVPFPSDAGCSAGSVLTIDHGRDPGVTDAEWMQLQQFKRQQEEDDRKRAEKESRLRQAEEIIRLAHKLAEEELAQAQRKLEEEKEERKKAELERQQKEREDMLKKKQIELDRIREELEKIEIERKKEMAIQTKLKQIGECPVGYPWIRLPDGYRCEGGSHYVSVAHLGSY